MRLVFLLLLLAGTAHGQEQNAWTMTCTDTAGRESNQSLTAYGDACRGNTLTGTAPVQRVDGAALPLWELSRCTVYLQGRPVGTHSPAPVITFTYPGTPSKCPAPPEITVPTNPTATRVANGYRIDCLLPAGTREVRMNRINTNGAIGSRVATHKACGFVYTGFNPAARYVLKSINSAGTQSERSAYVVTK